MRPLLPSRRPPPGVAEKLLTFLPAQCSFACSRRRSPPREGLTRPAEAVFLFAAVMGGRQHRRKESSRRVAQRTARWPNLYKRLATSKTSTIEKELRQRRRPVSSMGPDISTSCSADGLRAFGTRQDPPLGATTLVATSGRRSSKRAQESGDAAYDIVGLTVARPRARPRPGRF